MSKYVKVDIDDDFLSKHYPEILGEVLEATILNIEQEQVTPFFTGATEQSMKTASRVYKKEAAIVNNTDYASKIYKQVGHKFSTRYNKRAQAEWFETYLNENGEEFILEEFAKAIKRHGGA